VNGVAEPHSKGEFIAYLAALRRDLDLNKDAWENPTLERFLEAMQAWVADTRHLPSEVDWCVFADILRGARGYE
jgi:hypothetical protein